MSLTSVPMMKIAFKCFDGANPFLSFLPLSLSRPSCIFCLSCGEMGGYSLLIQPHEMNFCKCFNDPSAAAACVSHDKLVPGEDSDKVRFRIKVQKLASHSGGRPRDGAVVMGSGELALTTRAGLHPQVSPAVAGGFRRGSSRRLLQHQDVWPSHLPAEQKHSCTAAASAPVKLTFPARPLTIYSSGGIYD